MVRKLQRVIFLDIFLAEEGSGYKANICQILFRFREKTIIWFHKLSQVLLRLYTFLKLGLLLNR